MINAQFKTPQYDKLLSVTEPISDMIVSGSAGVSEMLHPHFELLETLRYYESKVFFFGPALLSGKHCLRTVSRNLSVGMVFNDG